MASLRIGSLFGIPIKLGSSFIFVSATSETNQTVLEAAFEGVTVGEVMTLPSELDTATSETSLDALLDRMVRERHTGYPVVDGEDLVGIVTLEDVQERAPNSRGGGTVRDVVSTDLVTVAPDTEATQAFSTLQREDIGRLLVTGSTGPSPV